MRYTRSEFLAAIGAATASCGLHTNRVTAASPPKRKRHIVTLSFDDGFKKSSIKTAEIYEKHKLSACINVVASADMKDFHPPDYHNVPRGDFGLWNDRQARGHEVKSQKARARHSEFRNCSRIGSAKWRLVREMTP